MKASVYDVEVPSDSIVEKNKSQFLAYPVAFYLPETRWGFGVAGFYNFRFSGEPPTSNPSQIQFTASYTQNKQVLLALPFELYRFENRLKLKGEFGYFRYVYNFYGVGNDSKTEDRETYSADFPRIRLDALRRFDKLFLGFRFRFDHMKFSNLGPILTNDNITGKNGGTISGLGTIAQWDTRDFIYNPTKGFFLETEVFVNDHWTGSDFNYVRLTVDLAYYQKLAEKHTLAMHLNTSTVNGNPIFYDLPYFGSPKLMRGYLDRRFMDKNILVLQSEYRFPIYKSLDGVSFLSTGDVGGTYASLFSGDFKFTFGGGLRFTLNKKDRVRLRLDYGRTISEGGAFYITINDAF
ncbi:MAG: BamA/TamA family outer membrane protein [Saprospiraceae bacterium]